jgi:hypothetical protein
MGKYAIYCYYVWLLVLFVGVVVVWCPDQGNLNIILSHLCVFMYVYIHHCACLLLSSLTCHFNYCYLLLLYVVVVHCFLIKAI